MTIYGSPYSAKICASAFMIDMDDAEEKWSNIPANTDILITHGPAYGILDLKNEKYHWGCHELRKRIETLKIPVHIFGHVHDLGGKQMKLNGTVFVNCSVGN